jgi:hypothetical protein
MAPGRRSCEASLKSQNAYNLLRSIQSLYIEGAPIGAKIYSVKTRFKLCILYDTEIKRDLIKK